MTTFSTRITPREISWAALVRFLRANGLHLDSETGVARVITPSGVIVGDVIIDDPADGCISLMQEGEYTTQDGAKVRAWWPTERPSWTLIPLDENLQEDVGAAEVGPALGPDEVVCDLCNAPVLIRPVPVVDGYALCARCFVRTGLRFPGPVAPYRLHTTPELETSQA